jgi:carboxylesterase
MSDILYQDPDHQPFTIGSGSTRALLIHGFLGSPRDLRPLAAALAEAGVTAHGMLLPGFGADIGRVRQVRVDDWLAAASDAWRDVSAGATRTTLVGFSMGGAVALRLAAEAGVAPDRLILLAPHWRFADRRAVILPLGKHFIRDLKPFGRVNFDNPVMRRMLAEWAPGADLDDAEVRRQLRDSAVIPTHALDELRKIGNHAGAMAARVTVPATIVQGAQDMTSLPSYSRILARRMNAELIEVPGNHMIVDPAAPSWPQVRDTVVDLATGAR